MYMGNEPRTLNLSFVDRFSKSAKKIFFNDIPSSGSRVIFGQTHLTKLIVAFRNVANSPKRNSIRKRPFEFQFYLNYCNFMYFIFSLRIIRRIILTKFNISAVM
jgi:hypothetical protein